MRTANDLLCCAGYRMKMTWERRHLKFPSLQESSFSKVDHTYYQLESSLFFKWSLDYRTNLSVNVFWLQVIMSVKRKEKGVTQCILHTR